MGLFDKKYCSICGNQIKLLGNRKLEDGNCCKECASKLFPFFSERRHSTVESIKEQLQYREDNKQEVAAFKSIRDNYPKLILTLDDIFVENRNGIHTMNVIDFFAGRSDLTV